MNKMERIQKGLDRKALLKAWNEVSEHTDYVRGLILIELRRDWESKKNNGEWSDYLKEFHIGGKSISTNHVAKLVKATKEKAELRKLSGASSDNASSNLNETEAELTLPDSASTQMELRGENAVQKARNYQAVKDATGKPSPSAGDIRQFNQAQAGVREKVEKFKKKKKVEAVTAPDPFTTEEEMDFETWCIEKKGINIYADKPKHTRAIFALKDENVETLFNRVSEWKNAHKVMAKLCHPDKGGNDLAMSFLSDFNELMKALGKVKEVVDFEHKVDAMREEYSSSSFSK